jgi:hypothetical protein
MRKLSMEEMLFGMVEGKEYAIVAPGNHVIGRGSFEGYVIAGIHIWGFFSNANWPLWDLQDNKIHVLFNKLGRGISTED